jgi:hypothetical protein
MATQKSEIQAQSLQERLNLRLAVALDPVPVSKSYDGNGDLYLTVAFPGTVGAVDSSVEAVIKFGSQPAALSGAVDALGLTQRVYSPNVIKVVLDTAAAGSTSRATELTVFGELVRTGMRVEVYGFDPSGRSVGSKIIGQADIAGGTLITTFDSIEWGSQASV